MAITAYRTVANTMWYAFLPKCLREQLAPTTQATRALEIWQTHYYKKQVVNWALDIVLVNAFSRVIVSSHKRKTIDLIGSTAVLVATILLAAQLYDQSTTLAMRALLAIAEGNETRAIRLIQLGANVKQPISLPTANYPIFAGLGSVTIKMELLLWAVLYDRATVAGHLLNLHKNEHLLQLAISNAHTESVARVLIDHGAELNPDNRRESVLKFQFDFFNIAMNGSYFMPAYQVVEKLTVIYLFIENGAKLYPGENNNNQLSQTLLGLKSLYNDVSLHTLVDQIIQKL